MKLSINFNRFVFGAVLTPLRNSGAILQFDDFNFKFRASGITVDSFRNLLKHLDLNYPRDQDGKPLSYTKLDSKQMSDHVMWIEFIASNSGYTLPYIEAEWNRLMEQHKGYK